MHISEISVQRPIATLMFFGAVLLLGIVSLTRLPVDLLPSLHYPKLVVWTDYPNASPEEVETFVTIPLEGAIGTVAHLKNISSISREGVSLITLEFLWGADMESTIFNLREKLDQVALSYTLKDVSRPTIITIDPSAKPIMILAASGDNLVSLKEAAEAVFKRRLERIKGVAIAEVHGGMEREIKVAINKKAIDNFGIPLSQVSQALSQANFNLTGGSIQQGRFKLSLRTIGEFEEINDLNDVVVARFNDGTLITIRDVAVIEDGFKERDSIIRSGEHECVGISLYKEAGFNTVLITKEITAILSELRKEYPDLTIDTIYEEAGYINESIDNVLNAIVQGGIFVFLILFIFLSNIRNPVNIAIAVPISIIATFSLLYFSGISLNLMSLGGLALGVGMLVDNSIVVLENIHRHREQGASLLSASINGPKEVSMAISASTFTNIVVFLPILFVEGAASQLFKQQALTMSFSLLASLVVSLTLLPMLSAHFLSPEYRFGFIKNFKNTHAIIAADEQCIAKRKKYVWHYLNDGFKKFFHTGIFIYEKLLRHTLAHRFVVITLFGVLAIVTLVPFSLLKNEVFPTIDQRQFYLDYSLPEGSMLEATDYFCLEINRWLRNIIGDSLSRKGIQTVFSSIGIMREQNLSSFNSKVNQGSIYIRLSENAPKTGEVIEYLRDKIKDRAGIDYTFKTGENVISKYLAGSEWDFAVHIIGEEYDVLKRVENETAIALRQIRGIQDVFSSFNEGRPEIKLTIKRDKANLYGLSVQQIASDVASFLKGDVATRLKTSDRDIDILVIPGSETQKGANELLNSNLISSGPLIPLREVVDIKYVTGPTEYVRENQTRLISVFGNVEGRKIRDAIRDIQEKIGGIVLPNNYRIVVAGENEEVGKLLHSLLMAIFLSVILVYMIMAAQFESLLHPFAIMFSLPMALIGTIVLLFLTHQSINVMSGIGIIILMGVAVNNAIILIDFANRNRKSGMSMHDAVIEAGLTRLRPILMTTLTTIFGLLPMVIAGGAAAELRRPLALALIGGFTTSTLLTLLCIPVIYTILEDIKRFLIRSK